ncbi:MAG TPA: efflux RND transporter periplasmic adaptor subunit [Opitutaceae bacterium]|nr:efflux RND transporter periplasmic adaptor subunit [Opitutaceae bacterium]
MAKRMILMLLAMILLVGGVLGYKLIGRHMMAKAMAAQRPPPAAVSVIEARELAWQPTLHAVGSFAAVQGIIVSAQLDGEVTQVAFESGAAVKSGNLLVQQDISAEQAQLASAEASAALARLSLDRAKELRAQGTNAQAELDAATAAFQQAQASVAAIKAAIDKKTIRAPFDGRLGIRQVNLGQFLRSGATIVPLQSLDPIYLNFALPQQNEAQVAVGQPVRVTLDAYPGETFEGTVNALNPNVDDATRNFQLQATLSNAGGKLHPGMFGSVELQLPANDKVITVPLSAIVYNPYGNAVYVVEKGEKDGKGLVVRQQFVQTGPTRGDQVAVTKGIKSGDVVVTAGQLKLRNGASIVVNNQVAPSDSAAPAPDHP